MIPTALVVKAKAKQLPIYEALLQCLEAGTGWKEMRRLWQSEWNRWELAGFTGCDVKRLTCTYLYVSVGFIQLYKLYLYRFLFEQRLPVNVQSCLSCLSYRCPSKWLRLAVLHGFPCFTPWLRPARPLGMWGTQHGYQTPLSWDWLAPSEASQGLAKRRRCVCFLEIYLVISGLMTTWFYCCIELPHFWWFHLLLFWPFNNDEVG